MASSTVDTALMTLQNLYANMDKGNFEEQMVYVSKTLMSRLIRSLPPQMGISQNTTTPVKFLDSACGTGVLTDAIQKTLSIDVLEKSTFLLADVGDGSLGVAKKILGTEGWVNAEVRKLDATNTGLPESSFTHVGLGLALHLIPKPDAVLADCKRILKPGGVFGATTFHAENTFWFPDIRTAFASFPFPAPLPDVAPMQLHDQGDWTSPAWIENHLNEQGFQDVKVTVDHDKYFLKSAEDYVLQFGMMLGWLMNTYWSEEVRKEHDVAEVKELIRKHLQEKYQGKGWEIEIKVICMTGRLE